jgi:hypothetical protein
MADNRRSRGTAVTAVPQTPVTGTSIVAQGPSKVGGILCLLRRGFRDSIEPQLTGDGSIHRLAPDKRFSGKRCGVDHY